MATDITALNKTGKKIKAKEKLYELDTHHPTLTELFKPKGTKSKSGADEVSHHLHQLVLFT